MVRENSAAFNVLPTVLVKNKASSMQSTRKKNGSYLLKYIIAVNFFEYLEAGAVPALLIQLTQSFKMSPGEVGLLGGIVYVSLSVSSPIAGYLLRHYDHQLIVGLSIAINNFFTLLWALTPVDYPYSTALFIAIRFLMGATQCVVCMFLPLWTNEFAPKDQKTKWMSYQQASVPFGVMTGYIIASCILSFWGESDVCFHLLCWRWPFIIEVVLLLPFCFGIFLVPREHINIKIDNSTGPVATSSSSSSYTSGSLVPRRRDSGDCASYELTSEVMTSLSQDATPSTPLKATRLVNYSDSHSLQYGTGTEADSHSPQRPSPYQQQQQQEQFAIDISSPISGGNGLSIALSPDKKKKRKTSTTKSLEKNMALDPSAVSDYSSFSPTCSSSTPSATRFVDATKNHGDDDNDVAVRSNMQSGLVKSMSAMTLTSCSSRDSLNSIQISTGTPDRTTTTALGIRSSSNNKQQTDMVYVEMKTVLNSSSAAAAASARTGAQIATDVRPGQLMKSIGHNINGEDDEDDNDLKIHTDSELLEERSRQRQLRRNSMAASLVDPFYTLDVVRPSYDDLPTLEKSSSVLPSLPPLPWSITRRSDRSPQQQQQQKSTPSENSRTPIREQPRYQSAGYQQQLPKGHENEDGVAKALVFEEGCSVSSSLLQPDSTESTVTTPAPASVTTAFTSTPKVKTNQASTIWSSPLLSWLSHEPPSSLRAPSYTSATAADVMFTPMPPLMSHEAADIPLTVETHVTKHRNRIRASSGASSIGVDGLNESQHQQQSVSEYSPRTSYRRERSYSEISSDAGMSTTVTAPFSGDVVSPLITRSVNNTRRKRSSSGSGGGDGDGNNNQRLTRSLSAKKRNHHHSSQSPQLAQRKHQPATVTYTSLKDVARQSQFLETSLLSTLRRRLSSSRFSQIDGSQRSSIGEETLDSSFHQQQAVPSTSSSSVLIARNTDLGIINSGSSSNTSSAVQNPESDGSHGGTVAPGNVPLLHDVAAAINSSGSGSRSVSRKTSGSSASGAPTSAVDYRDVFSHEEPHDEDGDDEIDDDDDDNIDDDDRALVSSSAHKAPRMWSDLEEGFTRTRRSESFSSSESGSDDEAFFERAIAHGDDGVDEAVAGTGIQSTEGLYKAPASASTSLFVSVRRLLMMPVYSNLLGAMTALYFTVTGVQYWGTTYLSVALKAPLPLVNLLFIICAATGPTLGVFFGGWFIDTLGGYRGMRQRVVALELCCFFGFLGCIFAVPVSFVNNIFVAVSFLWALLFCGAAVLPACSGMLVSIVPRRHRPLSSSITLVVCNMFGYSASLLVSGYLMQVLESLDSSVCDRACSLTWGFRLILCWSVVSLTFLVRALMDSYKVQERQQAMNLRRSSIYTYVVDDYNVYASI